MEEADTRTVSETFDSPILISTDDTLETVTSTVTFVVWKPARVASTVYVPSCRSGREKSPLAEVFVVRATPVASLVAVTLTPGSTPPLESAMRPEMVPRNVCARQTSATRKSARTHQPVATDLVEDITALLAGPCFRSCPPSGTRSGPADRRRQGSGGPPTTFAEGSGGPPQLQRRRKLHAKAEAGYYQRLAALSGFQPALALQVGDFTCEAHRGALHAMPVRITPLVDARSSSRSDAIQPDGGRASISKYRT